MKRFVKNSAGKTFLKVEKFSQIKNWIEDSSIDKKFRKNNIMTWFNGKKTFIGIAAGIIYSVLIYFKIVENNDLIWTAIAGWTGVAVRLAINQK